MGIQVVLSAVPLTAVLTGFATNVTGATWALAATTSGDSLAHTVTIQNNSVTNHSGKTALITGTDADGKPQTETLALPGASATVTGVKSFLTVTSIVPSATIGADTMNLGWSAVSVSKTVTLDISQAPFSVSLGVVISGTANVTLQHSFDRWAGDGNSQAVNWFNHATLAAITATADGNYAYPVYSVRLKFNSVTNGATTKVYITQGSR